MMQSYTEEDLIRFIYKEVDICEYLEMNHAVETDHNLREEYLTLKESVNLLPKVSYNPSTQSVINILNYSKKSFVNSLV